MNNIVWTVGYGGRRPAEFVASLHQAEEFRTLIVPEFPRRCERLIELAEARRTCLPCGCRRAASCHRSIDAD